MALTRRNTVKMSEADGMVHAITFPDEMQGCPTAWDFLTMTKWPDTGKARQLGSILFFVDGAGLKCRLMDNDCEQCAFFVVDLELGIWQSVEAALVSTSTDWRAVSRPGKSQRK